MWSLIGLQTVVFSTTSWQGPITSYPTTAIASRLEAIAISLEAIALVGLVASRSRKHSCRRRREEDASDLKQMLA